MSDDPYVAGTPEADVDVAKGCAVEVNDERGRRGDVTLTNDRLLFGNPSSGPVTGNLLGDLAGSLLTGSHDPGVLLTLPEVRSGGVRKRRLLPDLYEFTQADGATCRLPMKQGRKWEVLVRRLLTERHGRTVVDDGDGWKVQ
jgi:hypothetical protein